MIQGNIIKKQLALINKYFRDRKERFNFQPSQINSKIEKNNSLTKNFMRLLNKTMIGINKIQTNKHQMFYGILGLMIGYLCNELDDLATDFRKNYKQNIKQALIFHVLRNDQIKATLNNNLRQNVYKNKDIQFNLHQILYWKAIKPQQPQLFNLTKTQILKILSDHKTKEAISNLISESIGSSKDNISRLSLDFLESDKMDKIISSQLSGLLKGEMFCRLLSQKLIQISNVELRKEGNRESLYQFLRYKYMNY